jgi:hypothetical protein
MPTSPQDFTPLTFSFSVYDVNATDRVPTFMAGRNRLQPVVTDSNRSNAPDIDSVFKIEARIEPPGSESSSIDCAGSVVFEVMLGWVDFASCLEAIFLTSLISTGLSVV